MKETLKMKTTIQTFGNFEGQKVSAYSLENKNGTRITVLDYAGIWHEYSVIDEGTRVNMLLSAPEMSGYTDNPFYINRLIGRVAGRIKDATFKLGDQLIQTPQNEGDNSLHGGGNGWSNTMFAVKFDQNSIVLTATITSAQDGFPGNLESEIRYTLSDDDTVTLTMSGTQRATDGVFNPTSHAYFNLSQSDDVSNHELHLNSKVHLAVDTGKVPTGETIDNHNSPFDLRMAPDLGDALATLDKTTAEHGFDDVFVVQGPKIASLKDKVSSRTIDVISHRNGLVVFTANSMTSDMINNHGNGHKWVAVALEPHTLPNSENIPAFGDVRLKKDETRVAEIVYRYHK